MTTRIRLTNVQAPHVAAQVDVDDIADTLKGWVRADINDLDADISEALREDPGTTTVADGIDRLEALLRNVIGETRGAALDRALAAVNRGDLSFALGVTVDAAGPRALDSATSRYTHADGREEYVVWGDVHRLMAIDIVDQYLAVAGADSLKPDPYYADRREGAIRRIAARLESHAWDSWDDTIDHDVLWKW